MGGNLWQQIKRWGVVDTYLGFGMLAARAIFAVMFGIGILMCVSFWLTDVGVGFSGPRWITRFDGEWLRNHAYIPNILAGFTSFLIGAPRSAVVLATFTSQP